MPAIVSTAVTAEDEAKNDTYVSEIDDALKKVHERMAKKAEREIKKLEKQMKEEFAQEVANTEGDELATFLKSVSKKSDYIPHYDLPFI